MNNFKLVLLDYAKNQLDKHIVQKILNDLIVVKQKNYERTDPNYVVLDKHDMIGTHLLIYETSNLFEPRLISALRLTYESRARVHKLRTPIQDLIFCFDSDCRLAYEEFCKQHLVFADCNSMFVDVEFTHKSSGLRLADIVYVMAFLQLKRLGISQMLGCTNEKYKAHRWLENIGSFKQGFEFVHPIVQDPHMLILLENFNVPYLQTVYESHSLLFDSLMDVICENDKCKSIAEITQETFKNHWSRRSAG